MAWDGVLENSNRLQARLLFGGLSRKPPPIVLERANRVYFVSYAALLA